MHITDLVGQSLQDRESLTLIAQECKQFLRECGGLPIYKTLSVPRLPIAKVKARLNKRQDAVSTAFGRAFADDASMLRSRAIIASSASPTPEAGTGTFYAFIPSGYQFIYNKPVANSTSYQHVHDALVDGVGDEDEAMSILSNLIRSTYERENLKEGIHHGAELMFYNVPYFYVVDASRYDFSDLYRTLTSSRF